MKTATKKRVNHGHVSGEVFEGDKFYFIWNPAAPMPPTVMFDDFNTARRAAKRLAEQHPGEHFYVSESLACVFSPIKPKTTYLRPKRK